MSPRSIPHPIYREVGWLLAWVVGGLSLLLAGYLMQASLQRRGVAIIDGFHERSIYLATGIVGALATARAAAVGDGGVLPAVTIRQSDRALASARALDSLYAAYPGAPFDAARVRLNRARRALESRRAEYSGRPADFAAAFASQPLYLPLVAQQLERLHEDSMLRLRRELSRRRRLIETLGLLAAAGVIGGIVILGRRHLRAIDRILAAERAAAEALRVRDHAIDAALTPLAIAGRDERLLYANPAFRALASLAEGPDAPPASLSAIFGPEVTSRCREVVAAGRTWQNEHLLRGRDGVERPVLVAASAVRDSAGRVEYVLLSALDLVERRQLEARVLQKEKLESIGRLAGGVAHDFNNLLTAIIGNLALARQELPPGHEALPLLDEAGQAARSAADLTRGLLTFSRKQVIAPRVLDLNEVIPRIGWMLERTLGEGIRLVVALDPALDRVRMDPSLLEQILMNLAANARDAMPDGGTLTIETRNATFDAEYCERHPYATPGRYVMLAVSDQGMGMGDEVRRRLFEPFFTTKEVGQGTGLGLPMVYGAVKQHGGTIEVYSEPGQGASFKLYFPAVAGAPEPVPGETAPVRGGSERILLVEDEGRILAIAARMLTNLGYRVHLASDAASALALARELPEPCALLVTDVVLPGMNGRDLAVALSATWPGLKVLYTSGYTENVVVHHGVLKPGLAFLGKPYTLDELARRVRGLLDGGGGAAS